MSSGAFKQQNKVGYFNFMSASNTEKQSGRSSLTYSSNRPSITKPSATLKTKPVIESPSSSRHGSALKGRVTKAASSTGVFSLVGGAPSSVGTGAFLKKRQSIEISQTSSFSQRQQADKERKKLIEQQEELANNQFKLKRQANLASVKNAYINLERQSNNATQSQRHGATLNADNDSEDDEEEESDQLITGTSQAYPHQESSRQDTSGGGIEEDSSRLNGNRLGIMSINIDHSESQDQSAPVLTYQQPYSTRNKPVQNMFSVKPPQTTKHGGSRIDQIFEERTASSKKQQLGMQVLDSHAYQDQEVSNFKVQQKQAARLARLDSSQSSQLHNLGELHSTDQLKMGKMLSSDPRANELAAYEEPGSGGKITPAQFGVGRSTVKKQRPLSKTGNELNDLLNFEKDTGATNSKTGSFKRDRQPTFGNNTRHTIQPAKTMTPKRITEVGNTIKELKKKKSIDKKSRNTMAPSGYKKSLQIVTADGAQTTTNAGGRRNTLAKEADMLLSKEQQAKLGKIRKSSNNPDTKTTSSIIVIDKPTVGVYQHMNTDQGGENDTLSSSDHAMQQELFQNMLSGKESVVSSSQQTTGLYYKQGGNSQVRRDSNLPQEKARQTNTKIFSFQSTMRSPGGSGSPKGRIYQELMEPKIIEGRSNNVLLFQTTSKFGDARSPRRGLDSTGTKTYLSQRHQNLLMTNDAGLTNESARRSPRGEKRNSMVNASDAQRSSIDAQSQSLMSVTKHLMPMANEATIEDYKNELKQCLRENIMHKREIKHLRRVKKDADEKLQAFKKEIEGSKGRESAEVQRAVKKTEIKNRQLMAKLSEMKGEIDNLQKHNKEFKEYFDKQQERMNALRNVNQNLNKKLHQRLGAARKDPSFQEIEQHWQHAENRVQDLEVALKTSSTQLQEMNQKFRVCASKLADEEQKNEIISSVNAQLNDKLDRLEKQHKEALAENMRLKIGLKSSEEMGNRHGDQILSSRRSEVAIVHRRILSGPQRVRSSDLTPNSNSFSGHANHQLALNLQSADQQVKSSTQILVNQHVQNNSPVENDHFQDRPLISNIGTMHQVTKASSPVTKVLSSKPIAENSSVSDGNQHHVHRNSLTLQTVGNHTEVACDPHQQSLKSIQDFGGSSSALLSIQLKQEQSERHRLEEKQKQTQQDLDDLQNQVRLMQKLLASQTVTTNSNTKIDAMDSSLLQKNFKNFSNALQTPNQQLLSERFSLSPTPLITMQTRSNISGCGNTTNRTTEGFDNHYLAVRDMQTTGSKGSGNNTQGQLTKMTQQQAIMFGPQKAMQQPQSSTSDKHMATAESIKLRVQQVTKKTSAQKSDQSKKNRMFNAAKEAIDSQPQSPSQRLQTK